MILVRRLGERAWSSRDERTFDDEVRLGIDHLRATNGNTTGFEVMEVQVVRHLHLHPQRAIIEVQQDALVGDPVAETEGPVR